MICRLTTARSGEIIARLGSGNFNQARNLPRPSTAGESKLAPVQELSRRASMTNIAINGPKEPEDGTRAQPGPSSAKNVGQFPLLPPCCHYYFLFCYLSDFLYTLHKKVLHHVSCWRLYFISSETDYRSSLTPQIWHSLIFKLCNPQEAHFRHTGIRRHHTLMLIKCKCWAVLLCYLTVDSAYTLHCTASSQWRGHCSAESSVPFTWKLHS